MVLLDGRSLSIADVVAVARNSQKVELDPDAQRRIGSSRAVVEQILRDGALVYGINTGFGQLADIRISEEDLRRLQVNLVRSHASGVGKPLPEEEVRALMLARLNTLLGGISGVRWEIILCLREMLNRGVHPEIPEKGSLGASGDLAPLAHMALVLIGEGQARFRGERLAGDEAMSRAGINPVGLEAKEGVALVNGTSLMAGLGALQSWDALRLLHHAVFSSAMSFVALGGDPVAFDLRTAEARRDPGTAVVSAACRRLLNGYRAPQGSRKVQDAYTLRCLPQVLGAVWTTVHRVEETVTQELNSTTDNPLVFPESGEILSGGNFHGMNVAIALDTLAIGLTVLSGFAERRIARLVDPHLSGLPPFLTQEGGLQSGLMVPHYTAAALVSENRVLSHPASVDSLPTSANQEDYVSMGGTAALKGRQVGWNARAVIAIEFLLAAQGLDFHSGAIPPAIEALHRSVRSFSPKVTQDRSYTLDIQTAEEAIQDGRIQTAVEAVVGPFA